MMALWGPVVGEETSLLNRNEMPLSLSSGEMRSDRRVLAKRLVHSTSAVCRMSGVDRSQNRPGINASTATSAVVMTAEVARRC